MRKVLLVIFLIAAVGFFTANSTNFSGFFASQLEQKFDRILNEMLQKSLESSKNATAKEWAVQWEKYLQNLPASVESIISLRESDQVKVDKLVQLGLPAIPLIMDKIEQGSTELVPALEELLKGNDQLSFNKDKVQDYQKWVKENKDHEFVQALRRLVVEQ